MTGGLGSGASTMALKSDGTVWTWGWNNHGQLGDGTTEDRFTPVQASGVTGVVGIAAGAQHAMVLKADGTVWTWGLNDHGQLGDGTTLDSHAPVQVDGLTGVSAIAAGVSHSLALKSDGTVWAWGANNYGQLGDGTWSDQHAPVQVAGAADVVAIASGCNHGLALRSDGTAWAWGAGYYGELANGANSDQTGLVQMMLDAANPFTGAVVVAAGCDHSLVLRDDGTAWSAGNNPDGQLGDGSTSARNYLVQIVELTEAKAIAGANPGTLILREDGTVWVAGKPIGDGTWSSHSTTPLAIPGLAGAAAIGAGGEHMLVIVSGGAVWAWGDNQYGQVGSGMGSDSWRPQRVR
ncbi:MAG TPA: hypothetical protein P5076_22090 [Myxococcota bacterium]|nr:hypothetical protein [Myxococcota bacterium]